VNIRIIFLLTSVLPLSVSADCYDLAGRDYKIEPDLLRAVSFRESSWRDNALNYVSPDSYAIGRMQIHSQNFNHLFQFGITPEHLKNDVCMNIYTGAYYLAIAFKRWGYSWRAVGAYNAGFRDDPKQEAKRLKYAAEVREIYEDLKQRSSSSKNPG
jgi:soluble lytic murein transglycosylase-like protein